MVFTPRDDKLLDEKDKTILLHLMKNARTPLRVIAEAAEMSVSNVAHRIDKLEKQDVILGYRLFLNHKLFPLQEYDVYYKLMDTSKFTLDHAVKYLTQSPYTTQVIETMGYRDIRVTILAENMIHLQEVLDKAEENFFANIQSRDVLTVARKFKPKAASFIHAALGTSVKPALQEAMTEVAKEGVATLDETDKKILRMLSDNVRESYANIAKHIDLTAEAISARVKALEEKGIILGYKGRLNFSRLGIRSAVALFKLRHFSKKNREESIEFLKSHRHVSAAVQTVGSFDMSVTLFGETLDSLNDTLLDFRAKFAESVQEVEVVFLIEGHKFPQIAEGLLDSV